MLQRFFYILVIFTPALMLAAYLTLQSKTDPVLSIWLEQGNTFSPPIWSLFLLHGPVIILAIFGFYNILRSGRWMNNPIIYWFIVVPFFLYIPVNFQRRFIEGWFIPVSVLAALGWWRVVFPWLKKNIGLKVTRGIAFFITLTVIITPLVQLSSMIAKAYFILPHDLVHLSKGEFGAMQYLAANADCEDVILSDYNVGNLIPAYVCIKSFLGHWSLTPNIVERMSEVERFFDPTTPENQRIALIEGYNIRYVYLAKDDNIHEGSFLENAHYLQIVYQNPDILIFETQR